MRCNDLVIRGATLVALTGFTAACNTIVGVEEVSLRDCGVNGNFPLVASNPTTSVLTHSMVNGLNVPSLLILLSNDDKPDSLFLQLYDNMGAHGVVNAQGTYSLTASDAKLETCGICASINTDYDLNTDDFSQTFFAVGQGTLELTFADSTRLAGRLQDLEFRHVDLSGDTTVDIKDGCVVTVEDVEFDVMYSQ
ncbi:MAG TPA: hypothetical protein VFK02_13570 [Kofleriaceae bacterium]|nr:hypothetical protein [Kofleriaceae bacterium]